MRLEGSIDRPGNTIFHEGFTEVQEVSNFEPGQFEIGEHLLFMGRYYLLNRLQFDDYFSIYNYIRPEPFIIHFTVKSDGNRNLPLDTQSPLFQFSGQNRFIYALK